jgi:hypothetical protein
VKAANKADSKVEFPNPIECISEEKDKKSLRSIMTKGDSIFSIMTIYTY